LPLRIGIAPMAARNVVVLPAPLAPTMVVSCPRRATSETPHSTCTSLYPASTDLSSSSAVMSQRSSKLRRQFGVAEVRLNDGRIVGDQDRRSLRELLPRIKHHDAIGQAHNCLHQVLDHEDGDAAFADATDNVDHPLHF